MPFPNLNKAAQCELYQSTIKSLSGAINKPEAEAFADVISFHNDGFSTLGETFYLAQAVENLIYLESGECWKYLQISLIELAACANNKRSANNALLLNGFSPLNRKNDIWSNSPYGGGGKAVTIGKDFFANYLNSITGYH